MLYSQVTCKGDQIDSTSLSSARNSKHLIIARQCQNEHIHRANHFGLIFIVIVVSYIRISLEFIG